MTEYLSMKQQWKTWSASAKHVLPAIAPDPLFSIEGIPLKSQVQLCISPSL